MTSRPPDSAYFQCCCRDDLAHVQTLVDEVGGGDSLAEPVDVVFSSDSQDVYVAAQGDGAVSLFHRVGSTLAFVTSYPALATSAVATSGDGQLVIAEAVTTPGQIAVLQVYARDPIDGTLTLFEIIENDVGGVSGLAGVRHIAFSPDDLDVYTAAILDDAVARFRNTTVIVFDDGFESGDTSRWSSVVP